MDGIDLTEVASETFVISKYRNRLKRSYDTLCYKYEENFGETSFIHGYTDHGKRHVLQVHKNIKRLINNHWINSNEHYLISDEDITPPNSPLINLECYILAVATTYHDTGMGFKGNQNETDDETRDHHAERSREVLSIVKNDLYNPTDHLVDVISEVISAHRSEDHTPISSIDETMDLDGKEIRTRLLGGILRLADEMDMTSYRVSELREKAMGEISSLSQKHHSSQRAIASIKTTPKGELEVSIPFESFSASEIHRSISMHIKKLNKELKGLKDVFSKAGIRTNEVRLNNFPIDQYFDLREELEDNDIVIAFLLLMIKHAAIKYYQKGDGNIQSEYGIWIFGPLLYIPKYYYHWKNEYEIEISEILGFFEDSEFQPNVIIFGSPKWGKYVETNKNLHYCPYDDLNDIFEFVERLIFPGG